MTSGSTTVSGTVRPLDLRRLSRSHLLVAALLPIVLLGAWGTWLIARGAPSASVGAPAPDFALADLDGQPVRLADLRGRPVVVNFWASWCGPCVEEFPLLREAASRHADDGLAVIGIIYRDRSEAAREFSARLGATWPSAVDPGERVADRYAIFGPPETFFIDRDGIIAGRQIGPLSAASLDAQLAAIIDEE
jgi:cytochrome c biogenesis protein CcmG/thiol:disulfide interchange protein DsbE